MALVSKKRQYCLLYWQTLHLLPGNKLHERTCTVGQPHGHVAKVIIQRASALLVPLQNSDPGSAGARRHLRRCGIRVDLRCRRHSCACCRVSSIWTLSPVRRSVPQSLLSWRRASRSWSCTLCSSRFDGDQLLLEHLKPADPRTLPVGVHQHQHYPPTPSLPTHTTTTPPTHAPHPPPPPPNTRHHHYLRRRTATARPRSRDPV